MTPAAPASLLFGVVEPATLRTHARQWVALAVLCCAFFIEVLATTSVFTAGPEIAEALGLSSSELQWTFTVCTLPAAALLLLGGRLADRYGARRLFVVGLLLLTVASAICGAAGSTGVLLAGRAAQGIAAALTMPAALSLVITIFTAEVDRNRALAAWSAVGGIGATAGLVLGGLVTDGLGWRWVFFSTVPIGLVLLAMVPAVLPPTPARPGRLDLLGALIVTLALAAFVYGVSGVPTRGWWHVQTLGAMVAGLLLGTLFVVVEARTRSPLVPLRLFARRHLLAGNLILVIAGMCVDGLLFTLTNLTQGGFGWSAWGFAALASIMTVVSIGATWAAQRLVGVLGTRRIAAAGLFLLVLGSAAFAVSVASAVPVHLLVVGMVLFGGGMGAAFVAGSIAALADVDPPDTGIAAGLQNVSFGVGTTLGVAILATVLGADGDGYRAAFLAGAVIATIGVVVALAVTPRAERTRAPVHALPTTEVIAD